MQRDDLATIAPLWRNYTLAIKEEAERDPSIERQYGGIQVGWGAEMFGETASTVVSPTTSQDRMSLMRHATFSVTACLS